MVMVVSATDASISISLAAVRWTPEAFEQKLRVWGRVIMLPIGERGPDAPEGFPMIFGDDLVVADSTLISAAASVRGPGASNVHYDIINNSSCVGCVWTDHGRTIMSLRSTTKVLGKRMLKYYRI